MGVQGLFGTLKPYASISSSSTLSTSTTSTGVSQSTTTTNNNKSNNNTTYYKNNIRDFHGKRIAVDASSWMYKSVYSIAEKYVENVVEKKLSNDTQCINTSATYMYQRCIELIQYAQIHTIYLVIDGVRCPLKLDTNNERENKRQQNLVLARQYKKSGNVNATYEKYKCCIKITSEFTSNVITQILKLHKQQQHPTGNNKIQIILSPYEADAQLVQLIKDHRADAVITEDSDILVYSAACQVSFPIIYKLDRTNGSCDIWNMDWLLNYNNNNNNEQIHQLNTTTKTIETDENNNKPIGKRKRDGNNAANHQLNTLLSTLAIRQQRSPGLGCRLFVQACILTGCDYAPSTLLSGVGFITALKALCNALHRNNEERIQYVVQQQLGVGGNTTLSNGNNSNNNNKTKTKRKLPIGTNLVDAIELLQKCEAVFYYHPVRDANDQIVLLSGLPNMNEIATTASTSINGSTSNDNSQLTSISSDKSDDVSSQAALSTVDNRPSLARYCNEYEPDNNIPLFLGNLQDTRHQHISLVDQLREQHLKQQRHPFRRVSMEESSNINNTTIDGWISSNRQPIKKTVVSQTSINPYSKQTTKEQRESIFTDSKVLQPMQRKKWPGQVQEINNETNDRTRLKKRKLQDITNTMNPFKKFSLQNKHNENDADTGIEKNQTNTSNKGPSMIRDYLNTTSSTDIRYVKRTFPTDGTRSTIPQSSLHHITLPIQHNTDLLNAKENQVCSTRDDNGNGGTTGDTRPMGFADSIVYDDHSDFMLRRVDGNYLNKNDINHQPYDSYPPSQDSMVNIDTPQDKRKLHTGQVPLSSPESLSSIEEQYVDKENTFPITYQKQQEHQFDSHEKVTTNEKQVSRYFRRVTMDAPPVQQYLNTTNTTKDRVANTCHFYNDFLESPDKFNKLNVHGLGQNANNGQASDMLTLESTSPNYNNGLCVPPPTQRCERKDVACEAGDCANSVPNDIIQCNNSLMPNNRVSFDDLHHNLHHKDGNRSPSCINRFKFYDSPALKEQMVDLTAANDDEESVDDDNVDNDCSEQRSFHERQSKEVGQADYQKDNSVFRYEQKPANEKSRIGPAKPLRYRFTSKPSTSNTNGSVNLIKAFQKQEKIASQNSTSQSMLSSRTTTTTMMKSTSSAHSAKRRSSIPLFLRQSREKRSQKTHTSTTSTTTILAHFPRLSPPSATKNNTV